GDRALQALGSVAACRALDAADRGQDSRRDHRRQAWRSRARPPRAGAHEGDDLLDGSPAAITNRPGNIQAMSPKQKGPANAGPFLFLALGFGVQAVLSTTVPVPGAGAA